MAIKSKQMCYHLPPPAAMKSIPATDELFSVFLSQMTRERHHLENKNNRNVKLNEAQLWKKKMAQNKETNKIAAKQQWKCRFHLSSKLEGNAMRFVHRFHRHSQSGVEIFVPVLVHYYTYPRDLVYDIVWVSNMNTEIETLASNNSNTDTK